MLRFIARRLLLVLPVLFGLVLLTFILTRVVPTDPAAVLAGEGASPEQVENIREKLGFENPHWWQCGNYIGQVLHGDFGIGYYTNRPVLEDILYRLPATLELTFLALLLSVVVGIPLGLYSAVHHNTWLDQLLRAVSVAGLAIAPFWLAIILQLTFSMDLDWLPLRGRIDPNIVLPPTLTGFFLIDSLLAARPDVFFNALRHLVLPVLTLAFGTVATIVRFTRSGVLETLQKDFVAYERAAGYPRPILLWKYVLRNSIISTVTQIGLLFGSLLAGAVVIEAIFDWPGLGGYLVGAILASDYQAVVSTTLVIGLVYAVLNIFVDVAHALIDPRISQQL